MDKTIVTALLIIAGVVTAVILFNTIYPAVVQSGDALTSRQRRIDERLHSQIEIVHAAPRGVADVSTVDVWVKNIGSLRIAPIENCDVFFGPEGDFSRIPYDAAVAPKWTHVLEGNATEWTPTATLKITIDLDYTLSATTERYYVKVVAPNGISDEYIFSFSE